MMPYFIFYLLTVKYLNIILNRHKLIKWGHKVVNAAVPSTGLLLQPNKLVSRFVTPLLGVKPPADRVIIGESSPLTILFYTSI